VGVRIETEQGIAWITLDRPEKLNALDAETLAVLDRILDDVEGDPEVGVVVITGAGDKAFVAGGDLAEFQQLFARGDFEQILARAQVGQALTTRIERFPKPVIAAVNGWALGGGCELAMACHIRIASDHARFGLPETGLGLIPGYGGTQRLPRLVGASLALDMILTGEPIDAAKALAAGLVSRVCPAAVLKAEATRIAQAILTRAPLALSAAIAAIQQGLDQPMPGALELEAALFARIAGTHDAKEGAAAFLQKRAPRFEGH
jgi:enoyl-CoA hydratase